MPEDNDKSASAQGQDGGKGDNASSGQQGSSGARKQGSDSSEQGGEQKKPKRPMEPRRKARIIFTSTVIAIIVLIAALLWLHHVGTYETTDDAQVDGHLNSIASRVNGTVQFVYVEDNQPVQAGQLLVKLDPADLKATAEKSKGQYDQAVAQLAMDFPNVPIQQNTNVGTVEQDQAQVRNAEASYEGSKRDYLSKYDQLRQAQAANEKAQKDLIRNKQLMDKREIAPSDYDQYVATAQQDQATVNQNQHALESQEKTVEEKKAQLDQQVFKLQQDKANAPPQAAMKRSQLDKDKANIVSAKAQYDSDMLNLTYTEIRSPVNGVATQRNAEIGARVNAAQQVMVIVQTDNQWVTANYKETQLRKMRVGQKVGLQVDSLGKTFDGTVENMPAATGDRNSLFPPENATGNYVKVVQRLPVRIKFDPNQEGLDRVRPGMSVETRVNF